MRGVKDHRFGYYDAQIWAIAKLNQVPVVLSEDFASGASVEGVTFSNPFEEAFDIMAFGWPDGRLGKHFEGASALAPRPLRPGLPRRQRQLVDQFVLLVPSVAAGPLPANLVAAAEF